MPSMINSQFFNDKKRDLFIIYFFILVYVLGQTGSAFVLTMSIDMLIQKRLSDFLLYMVISVLFWLVALSSSYFNSIKQQKFIQKISYELRQTVSEQVKVLEIKSSKDFNASYYSNMIISDIPVIEKGISDYFLITSSVLSIIFASIAMIYFNILIFLTAIVFGLLLLIIPKFFKEKIQFAMLEVSNENQNIQKGMNNWFNGVPDLINFNALNMLDRVITERSLSISEKKVNQTKVNAKISFVIYLVNIISQFGLIGITGILSFYNLVSFGAIVSVGNLSSQLFSSLGDFSSLYSGLLSTKILLDKFDKPHKDEKDLSEIGLENCITIKNLSYSFKDKTINYPDQSFVKGEKYVIKGNSGTGKTTLFNLLNGYLDDYIGEITWDNKPYKSINANMLRNSITNVSQKAHIFNSSIKDNIILDSEFDQRAFEEAIEKSCLIKTIENLSEKENTILDLERMSLSGGELQRISVARAIYHKTNIILLDEATSSLDRETADVIESYMLEDPNLMVLMITHNVSDKIKNMPVNIVSLD